MATEAQKKTISRTLQLKPIKFSTLKDDNDRTLSWLMEELANLYPTVGDRTDATGVTTTEGFIPDLCTFFNNYKKLSDNSCIFEIWSYEPGLIPQMLTPDPTLTNAVVDSIVVPSEKEGGEAKREFINIAHVLVFGHAAIVESTRSTGGVNNIQRYLNRMARKSTVGRRGNFFFTDAVTKDLSKEIERAGGAVGFTIGVSSVDPNSDSALLGALSSVRGYIPSSGVLTVGWSSKDKLPKEKVMKAYEEAQEQDEIESAIIHLGDGSSIRGMSKFKIKKLVHVNDIGGKNPDRSELKRKMVFYLDELRKPGSDGKRILDDSGALADNEIFIPNTRRSQKREANKG
ncbi:hypothetical protein [Pseudomonas faucium]|uniref:hypothetical protein n=1 Tax=Pseudomonas faucium TaxID=2740518 RepID=UPI001596A9DD|nr:hypothetical protein [Pseudomonas faucium]